MSETLYCGACGEYWPCTVESNRGSYRGDIAAAHSPVPHDKSPRANRCPDGGSCHHMCGASCFRVRTCLPLSGVYAGDHWPADVVHTHVHEHRAEQQRRIADAIRSVSGATAVTAADNLRHVGSRPMTSRDALDLEALAAAAYDDQIWDALAQVRAIVLAERGS